MNATSHAKPSRLRFLPVMGICVGIGLSLITGNAKKQIDPPRAGLEFRCPSYSLACCPRMTLHAGVFGTKEVVAMEQAEQIKYRWEVSGGKIVDGQGTAKVTIDSSKSPQDAVACLRVTLMLAGGPPELEREKSCVLTINSKCSAPILFDQFGEVLLKEEREHLDRLAKHLNSEGNTSVTFLVGYGGFNSCFWEAELRNNRAKNYLVNSLNVPADRIMTIDGGFRENSTMEIFISSELACGPFPTPSLLGNKAHVTKSCGDKYKEPF